MVIRFLVCLFVLVLIQYPIVAVQAKSNDEPVQSTQGIDIDSSVENSKPSVEQKNEQKQSKNRLNKYLKAKKKIQKKDSKRRIKQKELEFLERRLELKKQKLEILNSGEEKGETK